MLRYVATVPGAGRTCARADRAGGAGRSGPGVGRRSPGGRAGPRFQVHAGVVTGQVPSAGRRVGVGRVWIWVGRDGAEPDDGPGNGGGGGRPRLPLGPWPWSPTGLKPTPR